MGILDSYKDEDFDFGRLLVLAPESKETVVRIKESTETICAKRITYAAICREELIAHLHWTVCEGLRIISGRWKGYYKIYRVDKNAVSSFAALALDGFVAALEVNAQDFKKLYNSVIIHNEMEKIRSRIGAVGNIHQVLLSSWKGRKQANQIDIYTASIGKLENSYGLDLQAQALADINEVLENRW